MTAIAEKGISVADAIALINNNTQVEV